MKHKRQAGFTAEQMAVIRAAEMTGASVDFVARELGLHRTTIERKLLKHHHLQMEPQPSFRLVPLLRNEATDQQQEEQG